MAIPVITSPLEIDVNVLVPITYQITADNLPTKFSLSNPPTTEWAVSPTGLITGPAQTAATVFGLNIGAGNTDGKDTEHLLVNVIDSGSVEPPPLPPPPPPIPPVTSGDGHFTYTEYNAFAECIKDPCAVVGPIGQAPDAPLNLKVTTPGVPGSTTATATWTVPSGI